MRSTNHIKPKSLACRKRLRIRTAYRYTARVASKPAVPRVASMAMPRFRVAVNDKLLRALTKSSDALWPGQGRRGVSRLTRDAIKRYARYSDGNARRRAK